MAMATRVKVIVITETHFDHDAGFEDGEVGIPGYQLIRADRNPTASTRKRGGGTAMYIRQDITVTDIYREQGEDFELVACTLAGQVKHIAIYRRPGAKISEVQWQWRR